MIQQHSGDDPSRNASRGATSGKGRSDTLGTTGEFFPTQRLMTDTMKPFESRRKPEAGQTVCETPQNYAHQKINIEAKTPRLCRHGRATCYASFWGKLLRKWDLWIYHKACGSLRRMTLEDPGMSYLMELNIRGWNEQLNISQELRRSTELFHEALRNHRHNVKGHASPEHTPKIDPTPSSASHVPTCSISSLLDEEAES